MLVLTGLLFKLGAVPAHAWVPDVAEGAPVPAAAFLTVVPKIAAALALDPAGAPVSRQTASLRLLMALLAGGDDDARQSRGALAGRRAAADRLVLGQPSGLRADGGGGWSERRRALPALLVFLAPMRWPT